MNDIQKSEKPENIHSVVGLVCWVLVIVISFAALLFSLTFSHIVGHKVKTGEIASQDIIATKKIIVEDEEKSRQLKEEVTRSVPPVFRREHENDSLVLKNVQNRANAVLNIQKEVGLPLPAMLNLSSSEQIYLLLADDSEWQQIKLLINGENKNASPYEIAIAKKINSSTLGKKTRYRVKTADRKQIAIQIIEKARNVIAKYKTQDNQILGSMLGLAISINAKDFNSWKVELDKSVNRFLQIAYLYEGADKKEWQNMVYEFLPDSWTKAMREQSAKLISLSLVPNVIIDQNATDKKINRILKTTSPATKEINVGSKIVKKGEIITEDQARALNVLGIRETRDMNFVLLMATALLAAFASFGVFLYTIEPKHFFSPASLSLMATVGVITCGIASFVGDEFPQFVPVPAMALVLSVIFGRRISIVLTLLMILFLKVSDLLDDAQLVAFGAASGMAIGASINKRKDLMTTGFLFGLLQAVGYFAAVMLGNMSAPIVDVGRQFALQVLGGLSSCIVAIGSLPFLESIFGMVTPFRVTELTEADQPLLRQLEENAPGTYQHSLAVANLAESGAKSIGANVGLVRAGAMYHDIGKMVTPRFFIENQLGDRNPHDYISPEESRARVLAHVTNGLLLAQKHNIPKAVQAFIPEHQGTTIMAYFYHKACLRDGVANVHESDYRYPGPKPQTRETAIVMLADVSEAVTHTLKDPSEEEVEQSIGAVFKARWDDGQFSESGLTHEELEKVKKAFVRVWRTLHHERLKYPATTTGRMPVPPVNIDPADKK
jgi:putative nucleotidyltransferase with HDIG domain